MDVPEERLSLLVNSLDLVAVPREAAPSAEETTHMSRRHPIPARATTLTAYVGVRNADMIPVTRRMRANGAAEA